MDASRAVSNGQSHYSDFATQCASVISTNAELYASLTIDLKRPRAITSLMMVPGNQMGHMAHVYNRRLHSFLHVCSNATTDRLVRARVLRLAASTCASRPQARSTTCSRQGSHHRHRHSMLLTNLLACPAAE